ncbi:hypothetical protein [Bacillus solimangrovi]|uniref:Uncharacterized protein n=1 Tax=Bacillus solimangrovi TaxID=1305675 RepID=A0A1E5LID6_9BACI|nr:hypothetical protein [Bacillus solimangrovi]OEH93837.1 hypothetical protein BFG57_10985 [Bacillus solimangrovi]
MNSLLDSLFLIFSDFIFVILAIGLAMLLMSIFIKKKIILFSTITVIILGLIFSSFVMVEEDYTSFSKLYDDQLNEDAVIERVKITINDLVGDKREVAHLQVKDNEIIAAILNDLSSLKLENERESRGKREYEIKLIVANEVGEKQTSVSTIHFDLDANYFENHQIISESNHLKTIESLVNSEEVEWVISDEE